jgi:hypothetical protein
MMVALKKIKITVVINEAANQISKTRIGKPTIWTHLGICIFTWLASRWWLNSLKPAYGAILCGYMHNMA